MKKSLFLISALVFSLYLSGCARNNVNNDKVAYRDRNVTQPTRVNYNPNGAPITGVDNTDVQLGRNVNNYNNNITNGRNTYDNRPKMRVADEVADRVADLKEVDTANVIVTENNAYVAVKLSPSSRNEWTKKIENKISRRVKSVDPDIDNVFVSENPDFYDRMNTYASDIRNGKPVSGFFNQFTETIRRVFPKAK
jgi:spore cortex protein